MISNTHLYPIANTTEKQKFKDNFKKVGGKQKYRTLKESSKLKDADPYSIFTFLLEREMDWRKLDQTNTSMTYCQVVYSLYELLPLSDQFEHVGYHLILKKL